MHKKFYTKIIVLQIIVIYQIKKSVITAKNSWNIRFKKLQQQLRNRYNQNWNAILFVASSYSTCKYVKLGYESFYVTFFFKFPGNFYHENFFLYLTILRNHDS